MTKRYGAENGGKNGVQGSPHGPHLSHHLLAYGTMTQIFLQLLRVDWIFLTDFQAFSIVCPFAGNFKNYFTFVYNTAPWYDLLLQKFCTDCTIVFLAMLAFSTVKVRVHLSTPEL